MASSSTTYRPAPFPFVARLRTWWIILRISLEERLVYRGEFMLGTLMRFLPVITYIFFWAAVFSAAAPSNSTAATATSGRGGSTIAGYTYFDFIAYCLLTMVTRAFSSMPGLASGIAKSIRDGTIKKFLIQPVDMLGFLLIGRVAHKLVYYLVAILPFALVFYLCRGYFTVGWPPPAEMAAFIASLVMSFLLGYFLDAAIGLIGFWFLEVSSLLFVYMLLSFFLSGQMFPLDMLDKFNVVGSITAGDLVRSTPLQYLAYFPSTIFLGKVRGVQLLWGLAGELAWLLAMMGICRLAFNRGVRRYSAYGG
jgi:ABC-2 type transport system permease protein